MVLTMKEEFLLEQRFGRQRPFKTPDGYFDRLESDVMDRVGCRSVATRLTYRRHLRRAAWAACAAVVVAFGIFCFKGMDAGTGDMHDTAFGNAASSVSEDYMMDEMSDFAMLDNDDFYYFIADE